MQAVICTRYGAPDVLQTGELEKPVPADDEVLVRVRAAAVNFGDLLARNFASVSPREFSMPAPLWLPSRLALGWSKPSRPVLGSEFAGVVEAVGKSVTRFKPGDEVFAYPGMNFGAYAEYRCMPEKGMIAIKPASLSFEQAAAMPYGALTALSLLEKFGLKAGEKVLIVGASGSIGSFAVQIARNMGADVTGVCGTPSLEVVRKLGANQVIDYRHEDFTKNGQRYDLILDVQGKQGFRRVRGSLTATGRYALVSFKLKHLLQMLWTSRFGQQKVICAFSSEDPGLLDRIRDLVDAGKLTSIVDRCFPMGQAADAHRYAESGQKQGSIVLTMA